MIQPHSLSSDDDAMSLADHLRELRRRLLYCSAGLFLAFLLCYPFAKQLYLFLAAPLADAFPAEQERRMIYTGLADAFITYIKTAFFTAIMLTFPLFLSQLWKFVAPALYKEEKKAFFPFLLATPILFAAGAAVAYYGILPLAWHFFISFESTFTENALPVQLEARIDEYLSLTMKILFAFGLCFQLPVLLTLLVRASLISLADLKRWRRYALVCIVVAAAILTPPDIISQIGLAVPLYALYEISILLARFTRPQK